MVFACYAYKGELQVLLFKVTLMFVSSNPRVCECNCGEMWSMVVCVSVNECDEKVTILLNPKFNF